MQDRALTNKEKYLHPPTFEQIDSFIKLCRVSDYQFERFFAMAAATIKKVRSGYRPLPVKYWHIFYERIIPTYGVIYEAQKQLKKEDSILGRTSVRKKVTENVIHIQEHDNLHGRIGRLK